MVGIIARDPAAAAATAYDLIVVGAGVYGIAVTHHATQLGLRPLLLERDDFGGATTWNSLRILHGGMRSLQTFDVARFRDMRRAQGWFLRHFPEHVATLECLMPLHGQGLRRPAGFRAALALDRLLRRWESGDGHVSKLPAGEVLDAHETARRFPLVRRNGLEGGGIWYDVHMRHPQRIVIDWLRWACAGGATALNRVAVQRLLVHDGHVGGVIGRDALTAEAYAFLAPVVINCAGPWSDELNHSLHPAAPARFRATLAFNLLLDQQPLAGSALAVSTPAGSRRTYFIVPWGDRTLVGTYHDRWPGPPDQPSASAAQIEQMIVELNAAVPEWDLREDAVLRICGGLLPGAQHPAAPEKLETRERISDHGRSGGPGGLVTLIGVKFTTAPVAATRALRLAGFRSTTRGNDVPRPPARAIPEAAAFRRMLSAAPHEAAAWIRRIAAEESVQTIEDLVRRRTDWAFDPREEREIERLAGPLMDAAIAVPETLSAERLR